MRKFYPQKGILFSLKWNEITNVVVGYVSDVVAVVIVVVVVVTQ